MSLSNTSLYRIIQTEEGWMIQKRYRLFFWRWAHTPLAKFDSAYHAVRSGYSGPIDISYTIKD